MTYTQGSAIPTQSRATQYFLSCLLIIALVMPSPVGLFAQSQTDNEVPAAGRIISVAGEVNALDPDGNSRELTRRDAVYVGDTIYTGATGFAQIRLADDGLVALRALTEFAILDYQFEADPDNDVSVFQLLEGGMRTVTGAIGKQNRSNYRLNVGPNAYIGIRGTDYEAVITSSGVIATGVYDGGITFGNVVGSIDLGINADYDFAIMVDPNVIPQGLVSQPALLGLVQFVDVPDQDANNVADGANGASVDGQANDGNATPATATQLAGAVDNTAAAAGDQALIANATDNSATADSSPNGDSSLGFSAPTPTINDTVVSARDIVVNTDGQAADGDSSSVIVNPNEIAGDGAIVTPTGTVRNTLASSDSGVDVSVSGSSSGSSGVAVSSGSSVDGGVVSTTGGNNLAGGSSADGGSNQSTADNSGTTTGDTGTSTDGSAAVAGTDGNDGVSVNVSGSAGSDGVSASGDVSVGDTDAGVDVAVNDDGTVDTNVDLPGGDDSGSGDSGDDGSDDSSDDGPLPPLLLQGPETSIATYGVDWGKWGSSVDDNWVVVSNIDSELVQISTSDYFANVIPTEIAQMTGSHTYSTGIASSFLGSGSAGDVGSLSAAMHVNFDTGLISNGSLDVLVADQHWSVNFDGAINGGDVTLDALNGSLQQGSVYSSNNIDASLDGAFTGNQAEAFVGGFELLDLNNQNNFAEGLFTIER